MPAPVCFLVEDGELVFTTTGRYPGDDRAEEFGRRNGVPGELLVRLRPIRVLEGCRRDGAHLLSRPPGDDGRACVVGPWEDGHIEVVTGR